MKVWPEVVVSVASAAVMISPLIIADVACKEARPIAHAAVPLICTVLQAVDSSGTVQEICAQDTEINAALDLLLSEFSTKPAAAQGPCSNLTTAQPDAGVRRVCLTNAQTARLIATIGAMRAKADAGAK